MYISLDADVSIANVLVIASIFMLCLTPVVPTKKFNKLLIIKQKTPPSLAGFGGSSCWT
jgi:hypothetical protein